MMKIGRSIGSTIAAAMAAATCSSSSDDVDSHSYKRRRCWNNRIGTDRAETVGIEEESFRIAERLGIVGILELLLQVFLMRETETAERYLYRRRREIFGSF
jgi:hypothetical protein